MDDYDDDELRLGADIVSTAYHRCRRGLTDCERVVHKLVKYREIIR